MKKDKEVKQEVLASTTESLSQAVEPAKRQLPAAPANPSPISADDGFDMSDILIPRILLTQSQSDRASKGDALPGDYVNSLTGEKLAKKAEFFEVIPIASAPKSWVVTLKGPRDGKPKFDRILSNEQIMAEYGVKDVKDIPWSETLEGDVVRKNTRSLNFFVLLRKDIESGEAFPLMVSFQSTSYKAGKSVATHFIMSRAMRKAPYAKSLLLGNELVTDDKGNYFVMQVKAGSPTTKEEQEQAQNWESVVKSANVRVDDSIEVEADESAHYTSTDY